MPETRPTSRMKAMLMLTVPMLISFISAIFPLKRLAASSWKQNAKAKPITNDMATISVDSAISFSEISR